MAAPMRDGPLDSGHRVKVADPRTAAAKAEPTAAAASNNFEYDDNEWDIGIGDLIIDLDADIEKTNEKSGGGGALSVNSGGGLLGSTGVMASAGTGSTGKGGKMAVEHSATVDKGLKMKIKRTKPGTKTSEAKHEIVKSGEQNGSDAGSGDSGKGKHPGSSANSGTSVGLGSSGGASSGGSGSSKRGSSGHRRDKARDKHGGEKNAQKPPTPSGPSTPSGTATGAVTASSAVVVATGAASAAAVAPTPPDVNGVVRGAATAATAAATVVAAAAAATTATTTTGGATVAQQASTLTSAGPTSAAGPLPTTVTTAGAAGPAPSSGHPLPPQATGQPPQQQRVVFPVSSGPGPPAAAGAINTPGPPAVPASPAAAGAAPAMKAETPCKAAEVPDEGGGSATPPPAKKLKTEPKDMLDVCVGTSVGTITEPDCLGPCEPGTSVTLEGIVWHETEGGVLVVNVTWRGKTYVGTLLDCTRHDWAPPRFCDSPTSDLDARTPKGRGKRGRAAASASPGGDLSNFTETRSSVHSKLRNGGAKGRRGGNANTQPGGATVGASAGATSTAGTGSPTPFVPPRPESSKRKGRTAEESESPGPAGKKTRAPASSSSASPPASPVLLECPEPNCSKKYKHINGLKYHQSHAHGCVDDEDTKDAASLSENDESNVETPSPAPPAKSPEKVEPPAVVPAAAAATTTVTVTATTTSTTASAATTTTTTLTTPAPPPLPVPAASGTPPATLPVLPPPSIVVPAAQQAPSPMTPTQPPPPLPPPIPPPAVVGAVAAAAAVSTVPPLPKKEEGLGLAMVPGMAPVPPSTPEQPTQPNVPKSGVVSPTTPLSSTVPAATPAPHSLPTPPELVPAGATPLAPMPSPDAKNVVKPGVLRFGPPPADEYPMGVYCASKQPTSVGANGAPVSTIRAVSASSSPGQAPGPVLSLAPSQPPTSHLPPSIPQQNIPSPQVLGSQPLAQIPPNKPQFKVKSTASLMPDDKKDRNKIPGHKKKSRKSPAGSPHPQPEQPSFGMDASGRDDVQSPAYSDISDDAAPVLESEVGDGKNKGPVGEKKSEVGQGPSPHTMPHYGMYPFYGQPPYLVPSVQQDGKTKDASGDKVSDNKMGDKDKKDGPTPGEYPQKLLQQHYYPYGYVPGYPYNLEPSYPMTVMPPEDKAKESVGKDDKSPSPAENMKPAPLVPSPIQVPNPNKIKTEPGVVMKEKHQNENHQIIKESIEIKNQMHPYSYQRPHITQPPPQQVPQTAQVSQQPSQTQSQQQQEELRRYYLYPEQQRRKETSTVDSVPKNSSAKTLASPSHKHKEKQVEEKKEDKVKQEGVKPTMETQGPPPPPTSSYAYIHHAGYMQAPHYGALPFDPAHPMYRSMLVPGPYGANPYLHPQLPRYPHAPEDLSRPPSGPPKTLDLLQHHANQYYSSHKIHELQERALKSPTPKPVASSASPSAAPPVGGPSIGAPPGAPGPTQGPPPGAGGAGAGSQVAGVGKPSAAADGKDARSPPPQRHVHTHHHTHVGLGYPILAGQYPAPYGAAVLASQQAAAVAATVINPYPPK